MNKPDIKFLDRNDNYRIDLSDTVAPITYGGKRTEEAAPITVKDYFDRTEDSRLLSAAITLIQQRNGYVPPFRLNTDVLDYMRKRLGAKSPTFAAIEDANKLRDEFATLHSIDLSFSENVIHVGDLFDRFGGSGMPDVLTTLEDISKCDNPVLKTEVRRISERIFNSLMPQKNDWRWNIGNIPAIFSAIDRLAKLSGKAEADSAEIKHAYAKIAFEEAVGDLSRDVRDHRYLSGPSYVSHANELATFAIDNGIAKDRIEAIGIIANTAKTDFAYFEKCAIDNVHDESKFGEAMAGLNAVKIIAEFPDGEQRIKDLWKMRLDAYIEDTIKSRIASRTLPPSLFWGRDSFPEAQAIGALAGLSPFQVDVKAQNSLGVTTGGVLIGQEIDKAKKVIAGAASVYHYFIPYFIP